MAERLQLRILTPTREVLSREVDSANLTAQDGEVGILPGHAALLARLRPGLAWFRDGETSEYYAHSEGFLEVADDVVSALVDTAEPASEIDIERAECRRAEREAELAKSDLSDRQMRMAEVSLRKQLVRLQVSKYEPGG